MRAVYVVDGDGGLTGVLTRKTLVAKVVAGGLDPCTPQIGGIAEEPLYTLDADTPARRGVPLPRGERRRARARGRAWAPRGGALAQRPQRRLAEDERTPRATSDLDRRREGPARDTRLRGRRAPQQRGRRPDARRRGRHGRRAPRARGADRGLRGGGAGANGSRRRTTASPACSAAPATRSRSSRTRPAPGTWPSTPSTSSRGDRILTVGPSTRRTTSRCSRSRERTGAAVVVVPDDESGQLSLAALEEELARGARLVSLVHVPSQGGLVQPAAAVGRLCRAAGVPLLLDACQSVGQLPMDVGELGCDFLSATGRKYLRGPRGTGLLYVRRSLLERLEPPFLDLHAAEWADRDTYTSGRRPPLRELGDELRDEARARGSGRLRARRRGWGDRESGSAARRPLASQLGGLTGVAVHDRGVEKCGIVTFTVAGSRRRTWLRVSARRGSTSPSRPSTAAGSTSAHAASTPSCARPCTTTTPRPRWAGSWSSSRDGGVTGDGPTPSRELRGGAVLAVARARALEARLVAVLTTLEPDGDGPARSRSGTRSPATRSCSRPEAGAEGAELAAIREPPSCCTTHGRDARCAGRRSAVSSRSSRRMRRCLWSRRCRRYLAPAVASFPAAAELFASDDVVPACIRRPREWDERGSAAAAESRAAGAARRSSRRRRSGLRSGARRSRCDRRRSHRSRQAAVPAFGDAQLAEAGWVYLVWSWDAVRLDECCPLTGIPPVGPSEAPPRVAGPQVEEMGRPNACAEM